LWVIQVLRFCTKIEVRKSANSENDALPVTALVDLVTLTFVL